MKKIHVAIGYTVDYRIDANLSPKEQIDELHEFINQISDNTSQLLSTNSPYVLKALNLLAYEKAIEFGEVFEIKFQHNKVYREDIKLQVCSNGTKLIPDDNLLIKTLNEFNDRFCQTIRK